MAGASQDTSHRSCQQCADIGTTSSPWKLEFRSSKGFVTWVVAIAVFTDVFIYGMIIPILPEVLKTRVSVPEDELQKWMSILLAAFGGALFVGSPIFGYFADKSSSRQAPFLVGLLALGGSTVMFWVAHTLSALVIARALQGLSAAVVWTVGMALIVDTVGKDQVGTAMGIVSMAMTVGTVCGPFLGGVILSKVGYHGVFGVAIGLIILDIVLRLVMIERRTASRWILVEPAAAAETERLIGGSIGSQCEAISDMDEPAHDTVQVNGKAPVASVSTDDGAVEPTLGKKKTSMPGILRLLCSSTLLVVLEATIVEAIAYTSFDTVLPLYVMDTFKMGPMGIGLCFIPLFTPSFFSTFIGSAVDRYGARKVAFLGFILDVPAFFLLQLVSKNTTQDQILLFILLFFAGFSTALQTVALMAEVSHVVEAKEKECPGIFGKQGGTAQAYGLFNVAWSGGQVLGPLVAGYLVNWGGWATMVSVFGVVSGVTAVILGVSAPGMLRGLGGDK